jgi:hypothetical protein
LNILPSMQTACQNTNYLKNNQLPSNPTHRISQFQGNFPF